MAESSAIVSQGLLERKAKEVASICHFNYEWHNFALKKPSNNSADTQTNGVWVALHAYVDFIFMLCMFYFHIMIVCRVKLHYLCKNVLLFWCAIANNIINYIPQSFPSPLKRNWTVWKKVDTASLSVDVLSLRKCRSGAVLCGSGNTASDEWEQWDMARKTNKRHPVTGVASRERHKACKGINRMLNYPAAIICGLNRNLV